MLPDMTPIPIADYSPDPTLTEQQLSVIKFIATGYSIAAAADVERIHRNTVGYWRRTIPAFARELEFACCEQRRLWHDEAVQLVPRAFRAIEDCITDPKSSPSVRFRAATFIINMATDPQRKAVKGFPTLPADVEAISGQMLAQSEPEAENSVVQPAKTEKTAQSAQTPVRVTPQPGRNTVCPCGSGIKFKRCCLNKPPLEAKAAA